MSSHNCTLWDTVVHAGTQLYLLGHNCTCWDTVVPDMATIVPNMATFLLGRIQMYQLLPQLPSNTNNIIMIIKITIRRRIFISTIKCIKFFKKFLELKILWVCCFHQVFKKNYLVLWVYFYYFHHYYYFNIFYYWTISHQYPLLSLSEISCKELIFSHLENDDVVANFYFLIKF